MGLFSKWKKLKEETPESRQAALLKRAQEDLQFAQSALSAALKPVRAAQAAASEVSKYGSSAQSDKAGAKATSAATSPRITQLNEQVNKYQDRVDVLSDSQVSVSQRLESYDSLVEKQAQAAKSAIASSSSSSSSSSRTGANPETATNLSSAQEQKNENKPS